MKRTYEFDVLAKIDQAISSIDKLSQQSQKKLDKINFNTAVSAVADGFRLIEGAAERAFGVVSRLYSKSIDEALEAEKAEGALANALRVTGDFSLDAVANFDKLAKSIQNTTTFSADAVKGSVAIAKQYRLTNAETEKTIRVATDLAAITGTDLDTAVQKVSQTFSGFVDKGLAKTIPGLKNLSKEALISGDAVDLIAKRVQGSAEALGDNFAGATFRAGESLNDIFETLGKFITQNPVVIAGINQIAKGFQEFNAELEKNGPGIQKLVTDGFLVVISAAPKFVAAIGRIINNLNFLKLIVDKIGATLGAFAATLVNPFEAGDIFEALGEDLDALDEKFGATVNSSEEFFGTLERQTQKIVDNVNKAAKAAETSKKKFNALQGASTTGKQARLEDANSAEDNRKRIEEIAKNPVEQAIKFAFSASAKFNAREGAALGAGFLNQVLKGAEGAQKAVQSVIGGIADTLLPGIGGVASEIVGVLAQGPEEVKKQVRAFADALPQVIQNVVESLPVLIEALVDAAPRIVDAIVASLPRLFEAIISNLPNLFVKISLLMPTLAITFVQGIIQNIPKIVAAFAEEFLKIPEKFAKALLDAINPVSGDNGVLGTGGKGKGPLGTSGISRIGLGFATGGLSEVANFLGLAEGGTVSRSATLQRDRLGGVNLGSNETVIDSEITDWLRQLKNGGQGLGGQQPDIVINMGLEQFARISFKARKAGYQL